MNPDQLSRRLKEALREIAHLKKENRLLKEALEKAEGRKMADVAADPKVTLSSDTASTQALSPDKKVALFARLFRGREDVYAVRWESKKGKCGYSPACENEWAPKLCEKPRVKCADCENREFSPVTPEVIRRHLTGEITMGIYPMRQDETCHFLAVDFDKQNWSDDALAFLGVCRDHGIPAALERSRSGAGGHVWIFFDIAIPASLARRLGAALLTESMRLRPEINFSSYDRFFPSQDTMPKGGFGNLIAAPLQGIPRKTGNSVFVDDSSSAYPDQWAFLASVRKMRESEVHRAIGRLAKDGSVTGTPFVSIEDEDGMPMTFTTAPAIVPVNVIGKNRAVQIFLKNQIYIDRAGLPPALVNALARLAAFQNPEFYKAQSMRLSTYGKPRVICFAEVTSDHVILPRGLLDGAVAMLAENGFKVCINDKRTTGREINAAFLGRLHDKQKEALEAIAAHDIGIISAPTAFGKTVVAASLVAERKINTLILVHRRQLVDQWRERLNTFLDVSIGVFGSGKDQRTGGVDVGIIQSISRKGHVKDIIGKYGQVIADECHHLSAFTFEQAMKTAPARYVVGLTATPVRKDGHHPIITMQCGPVRFRAGIKAASASTPFTHMVIPRVTTTSMPDGTEEHTIHEAYAAIVKDPERNEMLFDDLLKALDEGRSPLFLTERTEHLDEFADRLKGFAKNVIVLKGGMTGKRRATIMDKLASVSDDHERVILATGRYIGEGFDDARLDTLFLAMPISWRGTLQQYVGRLHRAHYRKKVVKVYDYVDERVPMFARMYEKRLKGYKALGYSIGEK